MLRACAWLVCMGPGLMDAVCDLCLPVNVLSSCQMGEIFLVGSQRLATTYLEEKLFPLRPKCHFQYVWFDHVADKSCCVDAL